MSDSPTPAASGQRIPTSTLLAAAQADGAVQIPLLYIPLGDSAKVAIKVQVSVDGWNNGQPVTQFYEFDTGGKGFWLDSTTISTSGVTSPGTVETLYTSGNYYSGPAAAATVSFPGAVVPTGTGTPAITAEVGLITTFDQYPQGSMIQSTDPLVVVSRATGKQVYPKAASFPIFTECYGDFGASLNPTAGPPSLSNPTAGFPSLLSVLAQYLPTRSGLETGFIVSVPTGEGDTGWLILGVGSQLSALFTTVVTMNPGTPDSFTLPNGSTVPTYSEQVINADVTLGKQNLPSLGICLDTGCPHVVLHGGTSLVITNAGQNMGPLTITVGATQLMQTDTYATMPSPATPDGPGYINTGVQNFMPFQVLYNIATGKLYLS
ncbi:hypothetical protein [Niveispirillum sp. KHB5.9]|uniref:hypothetical protein n=1 Tax=Niveispirillum sp. KHB5.9 TaxID=3400269 RepID=UPI003A8ACD8C